MILTKIETLIADKDFRCEASADLVDQLYKNEDSKFRQRHLEVAFQVRRCKILAGQKYKRYEIVDDEGEVDYLHCVLRLDDYMIRNKLYPTFLIELITKYDKKNG